MENHQVEVKSTEFINLPSDIIFDILFRVPVKSLIWLKCSRKFWYAMMSDPSFVDMHLTRALRNPRYYVEQLPDNHIETTEICIKKLRQGYTIFNKYRSAGGLVAYHSSTKRSFYIWNPITGEKLKMPKGPFDLYCSNRLKVLYVVLLLFVYISTREYKLVHFCILMEFHQHEISPRGRIYTLGS